MKQSEERVMLQSKAYEYLLDQIKKGELQEDIFYSINKLAKEWGFTRTPFRDAVLRLEQEKYLDVFPSKGFQLHKMTASDIIETYQMRNAIEVFCFKQLSVHLDTSRGRKYYEKARSKVDKQLAIMNTTKSIKDFTRMDYGFHRSIVQYVDNRYMMDIYYQFMYRINSRTMLSFEQEGRMEEAVTEHQELLFLIENHEMEELEKMLNFHLTVAQDINLQILKEKHDSES